MGGDSSERGGRGTSVRVVVAAVWLMLLGGVGLATLAYVAMLGEAENAITEAAVSAMFAAVVLAGYSG